MEPDNIKNVEFYNSVADMLGIETAMGRKALRVALNNLQLFESKQRDYGSGNISSFGELGVLVRCHDKIARLKNLLFDNRGREVSNEALADSWKDLANYGIIGYLCNTNEWR